MEAKILGIQKVGEHLNEKYRPCFGATAGVALRERYT